MNMLVFMTHPQGLLAGRCLCGPANGLSTKLPSDSDAQSGFGIDGLHDFDRYPPDCLFG